MKIAYDPQVDILRILFNDVPIEASDRDKPGVILDYDKDGNVVGMKIMNASQRVTNPHAVEYSVMLTQAEADCKEEQKSISLGQRRDFIQLPIEERRCILSQQAEALVAHYQEDTEWREWLGGDIIDY